MSFFTIFDERIHTIIITCRLNKGSLSAATDKHRGTAALSHTWNKLAVGLHFFKETEDDRVSAVVFVSTCTGLFNPLPTQPQNQTV